LANVAAFAIGGAFGARWITTSHAQPPPADVTSALELRVPHARGAITLDGDTDDPGWRMDPARTGAFVSADGVSLARPHSEAKLAWGDGHLYVELYAADQDIRATHEVADGPVWESDSFHLVFGDGATQRSFDLSPLGTLTDGERRVGPQTPGAARPFDYGWTSGAHVSHELDGTPNHPEDEDEEWVIEMAIPFEALGLTGAKGERIDLSMRRCDVGKTGERSCGSWGEGERRGRLVLE
jgi:hypothetical protein